MTDGGSSSVQERWIVIPRWEEFQHRDAARASVPTWIKVMTRLLSDDDYLSLSGHRRAILHGLWLEYARSLRQLPSDTGALTRRLNLKVTRADLDALRQAGFIALYPQPVEPATTSSRHADDTLTTRAQTRHDTDDAEPTITEEPRNQAGAGEVYASKPASNHASTPAGTEKRREEEARAVTSQETPDDEPDIGNRATSPPNGTAPASHSIRHLIDQSLATAEAAQ